MTRIATYLLFICLGCFFFSCSAEDVRPDYTVEVTGTLLKPISSITTYQYGEFYIDTIALRSSTVDLDAFVGEFVTVRGHWIEGYPLSGGPMYVEVEEINIQPLRPGEN